VSGLTDFYVERRREDGTWELVVSDGEPVCIGEWANRDFEKWVFQERFREHLGAPPKATRGLPIDASEGTVRMKLLPEESIGWMWPEPLFDHEHPTIREFVMEELIPSLRSLGLEPGQKLRLILCWH
jgi:hypothetical protein